MKRLLSVLLSLALLLTLVPSALAAGDEAAVAAKALYELGILHGTGADASGRPVFDLDRGITRIEAVTLLVRLLGKEDEAISGTWDTPFTDVAEWARPYVGYAYANGLTMGTSATTFGGGIIISATEYITFVLRALGYESGADFPWNRAWELSDQIGLTDGRYNAAAKGFTRGDAAIVSYNALDCSLKNQSLTLRRLLMNAASHTPAEFDATLENIRVVVDGIVHNFDVQTADGVWYISAADAQTAFGGVFVGEYVGLDAYARFADIHYTQDEVLAAAYFNTWAAYEVPEVNYLGDDGSDFARALYMGLADESLRDRADEQISSTEFRALLYALVSEFAPDRTAYFDTRVTNAELPLTRADGIMMAYYAAFSLGIDAYNVGFDSNIAYPDGWADGNAALFPNWNTGPAVYRWGDAGIDEYWSCEYDAALFWAIWCKSTVSNTLMLTLRAETGDMDIGGPMTVRDAVSMLARIYDRLAPYVNADPGVLRTPSPILSEAHLAKANAAPEVTAENHPQWTGLVLDWDTSAHILSEENVRHAADWGFNSIRIYFGYRKFFNTDGDTYLTCVPNLQKLDSMIAAAIECGLHVDLSPVNQPGRETQKIGDFVDWGEFDLFVNPVQQEKAFWMWETLAARYRDIPSGSLTFSPLWEPLNYNLSTGLDYQEYTMEDVGAYLAKVIDVIREQDEDRLITFELIGGDPSLDAPIISAVAGKTNILANYNFADQPFVFYMMHVPEDGGNIDDNNHSMNAPVYPTYLYSVSRLIHEDSPIFIDGFLPAGTVLNLYLTESFGTALKFTADGSVLYREELAAASYEIDYHRSTYNPYAQSEKCITVTLPEDTDLVTLTASGDGLEWCGMDIILPEEYARDYWYFYSPYDVFLGLVETDGLSVKHDALITVAPQDGPGVGGPSPEYAGRTITVYENVTYTTEVLWRESSADTIEDYFSSFIKPVGGDPAVRFETANFAGVAWEDMAEYYTDLFDTMTRQNISWWSNDFINMTNKVNSIGGADYVEYAEFEHFNAELLRLLQRYQNSERP